MPYPPNMRVFCYACWKLLADEGEPVSETPCPKCGGSITVAYRRGQEFSVVVGGFKLMAYPPGRRGNHWFHKSEERHSYFVKDGRRHFIQRAYDRDNNWYDERIVDVATGGVVREVHEPLTDHQGRGSAKNRRN
jgi:hypothetical protein